VAAVAAAEAYVKYTQSEVHRLDLPSPSIATSLRGRRLLRAPRRPPLSPSTRRNSMSKPMRQR
jgi:hypothetical protein